MEQHILQNDRYQILTPSGWSNFSGIRATQRVESLTIVLANESTLCCTCEHLLKTEFGFVEANTLSAGDAIYTTDGLNIIVSISLNSESDMFFDCLDVEKDNEYITNDIVSHNCEFLGGEGTLMDNRILIKREKEIVAAGSNVLFTIHDVPFFVPIKQGSTYLMGVDPSTGTGRDFTTIEIVEFPSMTQVMEYRSNSTRSPEIYALMKNIIQFFVNNNCEIYFSVENNGVGEGIISLYSVDEDIPDSAIMIHEEGKSRYGFTTTDSTKLKYANKLKMLVETDSIIIHSMTLLKELKNFARSGKTYNAKSGSTDDCISAYLIIIRILDDLSENNEEAYEKLYALAVDDGDAWTNDDIEMHGDVDDSLPFIV